MKNFSDGFNHLCRAGVPIVVGLPHEGLSVASCFRDSSGLPLGVVYRGTIYLRPDGCTLSVLLHEYTHLWVGAFRLAHPNEWLAWVDHCADLPLYSQLVSHTRWSNPEWLADECLAALVGQAVAGSCVADASAAQWVSRVWADFVDGVAPVGVDDERPRCFFLGVKGVRRLRYYVPKSYKALSQARRMKRKGKEPELIKRLTGLEQGADFKWRYEENSIRVYDKSAFQAILDHPVRLKEVLDLPILYRAYPQLGLFRIEATDMPSNKDISKILVNRILVNRYWLVEFLGCWLDPNKSGQTTLVYNLLHEIQHAIQFYEGFSKGADYGYMGICQSPPMLRILAWDPPVFGLAVSWVCCNPLDGLLRGGLTNLQEAVADLRRRINQDCYLNRLCLDQLTSVAERCDEEGYLALVRLLHAALHRFQTCPEWGADEINRYFRYAGEVEARNAALRTLKIRQSLLAEQTEEFSRDEQLLAFVYAVSNLTRVEWRNLSGKIPFAKR